MLTLMKLKKKVKKVRKILVLERWEKNLMAMMDVLIFSPEGALA